MEDSRIAKLTSKRLRYVADRPVTKPRSITWSPSSCKMAALIDHVGARDRLPQEMAISASCSTSAARTRPRGGVFEPSAAGKDFAFGSFDRYERVMCWRSSSPGWRSCLF